MVRYGTILDVIEEYTLKCTDYPKYQAMKYFKEHRDEFLQETWDEGEYHDDTDESPPGHLFTSQEEAQRNVNYSEEEKYCVEKYGRIYFKALQAYKNNDRDKFEEFADQLEDMGYMGLKDGGDYRNMEDWEIRVETDDGYEMVGMSKCMNYIDKAIDKSPRLQQDTVLYGYARLPTDGKGRPVEVGKTGTYKGLRGMSYNKTLVHDDSAFLQRNGWVNPETRYNITYYCLKGTPGVNLGHSVDCSTWQNERLLPSGQRCVVYEVNDRTKEAVVIVY